MDGPEELRTPRSAGELRALTHPLRIRIMVYLTSHDGAATSAGLARALGESTGATSYHLRQLARQGFVEEVPGYGTARERGWRAAVRGVGYRPDSSGDEEIRSVQEVSDRIQDILAEYRRQGPADRPEGADRVYTVLRLIPAQDDKSGGWSTPTRPNYTLSDHTQPGKTTGSAFSSGTTAHL